MDIYDYSAMAIWRKSFPRAVLLPALLLMLCYWVGFKHFPIAVLAAVYSILVHTLIYQVIGIPLLHVCFKFKESRIWHPFTMTLIGMLISALGFFLVILFVADHTTRGKLNRMYLSLASAGIL